MCRGSGLPPGRAAKSFRVDRLVYPSLVEGRRSPDIAPDLVRCLALAVPETERRPDAEIEIVHGFEAFDDPFGVELRTHLFQGFDRHVRRNVALEGGIIRRLACKIFSKRVLMVEHQGRMAGHGRHDLKAGTYDI